MDYTHARMLERIVDRINALNNTQIEPSEVEIKAVGTKYSVTPKPGSRYYRMDLIQYSEIDIAKLFHGVPLHLTRTEGMTYADVITWVNETFALDMHQADFGQDLTAVLPEEDGVIALEILEDCPFFMGTLSIEIRADGILISSLWKDTHFYLPYVDDTTSAIKTQTTYLTLPIELGVVDSVISSLIVGQKLTPRAVAFLSSAVDADTILLNAYVKYNGLITDISPWITFPPQLGSSKYILVLEYPRSPGMANTGVVYLRYDLDLGV